MPYSKIKHTQIFYSYRLPLLIETTPALYQEDTTLTISFIRQRYSRVKVQIFIHKITKSGLKDQIIRIFEKILNNLDTLGLPFVHTLQAEIRCTCLPDNQVLQPILQQVAEQLTIDTCFYTFFAVGLNIRYIPDTIGFRHFLSLAEPL